MKDPAAFIHQAQLEFSQRNACEKCGEPAIAMWDDRAFCNACYDVMTLAPREPWWAAQDADERWIESQQLEQQWPDIGSEEE